MQGLAERRRAGLGVGERDLDERALERERRAQLVRGVGRELALRVEGRLEPAEELVEGVAELGDLVVGPVEREAPVQARGGDLPGGVRDRSQRDAARARR